MLFFESIPKKRRDFIRSFRESEVNTAPPSPVLNNLVAWNEVVEISPQEKIDFLLCLTPNACAPS
jgi:hypothetical protein